MNCILGTLILFAGYFTPVNTLPADGQLIPISGNEALYSILGNKYGPSGKYEFRLPNLNKSPNPMHNANPFNPRWLICVEGTYPSQL